MLLNPDYLEKLRVAMERPNRSGIGPFKGAARSRRPRPGRAQLDPLAVFIQGMLEHQYGPLVFVVDGSLPMTFAGDAPPVPSGKFRFAQRLAATVGAAALQASIPVHLVPVGAVSGRRGPILRRPDQTEQWLNSVEEFHPGGTRQFRYALRNQILRGGPDAYVAVLSDFRNVHWASALSALVAGESRVALMHIVDANDILEPEDPPAMPVPFAVGSPEALDEPPPSTLPSAGAIHQYLQMMAVDHRLELIGIHDQAPVEESVLRAAEARR